METMLRKKLTFFDDYWIDFHPGAIRRWYSPAHRAIFPELDTGYAFMVYDSEQKNTAFAMKD